MDKRYDRIAGTPRSPSEVVLIGQHDEPFGGRGKLAASEGKPEPLVLAVVVDIMRTLAASVSVSQWISGNLYVPDTVDRAALNQLEREAIRDLRTLADVCRRPHDRLDSTTELVRAELARRVPPRGLVRLASHTEDWAGFEHGRIRPRQVLAQRYVELFDFYENRVAAQLVDRLHEYVLRRVHELETLADGIVNLDEYQQKLQARQSWRRKRRMSELVATAVSETAGLSSLIKENHAELTQLRSTLFGLRDSPGHRNANRKARLPARLMWTNLFTNDTRYRVVGRLWESWSLSESRAKELQQNVDDSFLSSYDQYVAALAVRACGVLGFVPLHAEAPVPAAGTQLRLKGPGGELSCSVDHDGALTITAGSQVLTRVIALGHDLSSGSSTTVRAWLDELESAAMDSSVPLVVAYPGLRAGRKRLPHELRERVHSINLSTKPGMVAVVPVTPLEIEGEERLARAMRWAVQGLPMVRNYPPRMSLHGRRVNATAPWFRAVKGGLEVQVLRRPSDAERSGFLETVLGTISRERSFKPAQVDKLRQDLTSELARLTTQFDLFDRCPVCTQPHAEFQHREPDMFHARCRACETRWDVRACGSCTKRYPVLWPKNSIADARDTDRLDLTAGADVLASPCVTAVPGTRFRCPWCRICAGMPSCGCDAG